MIKFISVILLFFNVLSDYIVEKSVLILDDRNFDQGLSDFEKILVLFYKSNNQKTMNFLNQYNKAASELMKQNSKIRLAKVDLTINHKINKKYEFHSFPTLKYFSKKSIIIDYNGRNTSQAIIQWLQKINKPILSKLKNISQLLELNDGKISVVFLGAWGTYQYHYFFRASLGKQEFNYFHITQNDVLKQRKVPAIVGYVPFNKNKWVQFDKKFTIKQISQWFQQISIPDILQLNKLVFHLLQQNNTEGLILFDNKIDTQNIFSILQKYCPQQNFELICIQVNQKNEMTPKLVDWLKIESNLQQSKLFIVNGKQNMKYIYRQKLVDITQQKFTQFYEKYKKKSLIGNPIIYRQTQKVDNVVNNNEL